LLQTATGHLWIGLALLLLLNRIQLRPMLHDLSAAIKLNSAKPCIGWAPISFWLVCLSPEHNTMIYWFLILSDDLS
jgi:hypothetical protein